VCRNTCARTCVREHVCENMCARTCVPEHVHCLPEKRHRSEARANAAHPCLADYLNYVSRAVWWKDPAETTLQPVREQHRGRRAVGCTKYLMYRALSGGNVQRGLHINQSASSIVFKGQLVMQNQNKTLARVALPLSERWIESSKVTTIAYK
jgi:hypothetical protein